MANFWKDHNDIRLAIPVYEEMDGIVYYAISTSVGDVNWSKKRRYSEFYDLHQILVAEHGVNKDWLPPKAIRNKDKAFLMARRLSLEAYIQRVFRFLHSTMPQSLVEFLRFDKYEVYFQARTMAYFFLKNGERLLAKSRTYSFSPFQLHCVRESMKTPHPQITSSDPSLDISHLLDFCSHLDSVIIRSVPKYFACSNIEEEKLPFDLAAFKNIQSLEVSDVPMGKSFLVGAARASLLRLVVHGARSRSISDILLCDVVHKTTAGADSRSWPVLSSLDLARNDLSDYGNPRLYQNVERLDLSRNCLRDIADLSCMSRLRHLRLCDNTITSVGGADLHTKLGNVVVLDLAHNRISSLKGFSRLYSVETLDLSGNLVEDVAEVVHLSALPVLEHLRLTGNPLATIIDYRVKVLEHFEGRSALIYLDNEKASQKELDTVSILRALRISKEGAPDPTRRLFI